MFVLGMLALVPRIVFIGILSDTLKISISSYATILLSIAITGKLVFNAKLYYLHLHRYMIRREFNKPTIQKSLIEQIL